MSKTIIRVDYPPERMAANARRMLSARARLSVDRAPVLVGAYERFLLAQRGVSYGELYSSAHAYLYHKIMNQVWAIQNMPDDRCQAPGVTVYLDFENTADASAFGARVVCDNAGMPWTQPNIESPEDIDLVALPEPDAGLWGKLGAWYQAMLASLDDYCLLFNGQEAPITVLPPDPGGEGPFTIALQLAGVNLYEWLKRFPAACHRMLDTITIGLIRQHEYVRRRYPHPPRRTFSVINDGAELLSPALFRTFCVPYDNRLYDALGSELAQGRGKHMCGKIDHLLQILVEEERITSLWGCGHVVDAETLARAAGGRCWVQGNISPVLLLEGDPASIRQAARRVLAAFAPHRGLILSDGFNLAPGTRIENVATLVRASEEWGPM
jgi:uroporphyrinogen-III decarboxylase